ncbi:MAG: sigma-54 dependent transcriptional regulator [Deltaproteobacteria bacterium]|nr:sigma-54 dependent transcriptional regulator [Deltaproteobacteria bacterium]
MPNGTILLVGLSPMLTEAFEFHAAECGFAALYAEGEIPSLANPASLRLCVIEVRGDERDSYARVKALSKKVRPAPIVVLTPSLRAAAGARLTHLGVAEVVDLPAASRDIVAQAFRHIASASGPSETEPITGESHAIRAIRQRVADVARTPSTVLLLGETGTGKGLIAKVIHDRSPRRGGPLIHLDCAALSSTVIESELFGHERGAFTGASELRRGRFELAESGTIFLDEIGDLDTALQAKLLRVLQDRTYERVGGTKTLRMNARVIAATNHDLSKAVREGRFRRDLYYRLNVFRIQIPPLRERKQDIPVLVRIGLDRLSGLLGVPRPRVSDAFYDRLSSYPWYGNVRELMNVLERCLVQRRVAELEPEDLDEIIDVDPAAAETKEAAGPDPGSYPKSGPDERGYISEVLRASGWNVTRASRRLGMARSTLRYKLKQYDLESLIPKD